MLSSLRACRRLRVLQVRAVSSVPLPAAPPAAALPAAPLPPVETLLPVEVLAPGAEPTLLSLGMGGWSPVGFAQSALEYLHIAHGLPWWGTIAIGTVCVRLVIFPLVLMGQRNGAHMANNMPRLSYLQNKMSEAKQTGNQLETARYNQEIAMFMKEKKLNPLKSALVPLAQLPFFLSFFIGLRRMTAYPVESMQYGGLFWFTDLTVPDQFYLLPVITSVTLLATMELGTDTSKMTGQKMQLMRYVFRAIPFVMLPFTINFPGAILCYWACSNFMSLGQVGLLKIPKIRDFFKIPKLINHPADILPAEKKGFVNNAKDMWSNLKVTREIEGRQRTDEMSFNKAGKGPLQKTYKYNPTVANLIRAKGSR